MNDIVNYGSAASAQLRQSTDPQPAPDLERLRSRLENTAEMLGAQIGRLHRHADAVHGALPPSAVQGETNAATAPGAVGRLFQMVDALEGRITALSAAVDRFSSLA